MHVSVHYDMDRSKMFVCSDRETFWPALSHSVCNSSQLPAEGASSQGHSLEPRHVHSFIRLRSAVAQLSGHRILSPTLAARPCVILFNLNWCLLECPVKCVKSKDVPVLLGTVGTQRTDRLDGCCWVMGFCGKRSFAIFCSRKYKTFPSLTLCLVYFDIIKYWQNLINYEM